MNPLEQLYCAIVDDESDEISRFLTASSIDINAPIIGPINALMLATRSGSLKSLKKLIELGAAAERTSE